MSKLQLTLCFHIVAVIQRTGNLRMFIEHAHKKAQPVKLNSLANFGRPTGSGTKKVLKEFLAKNIFQTRKSISALPL